MNPLSARESYLRVSTQTASPGHLVLMLYEGALSFLDRALQGFSIDDPADANQTINNNIQRAQVIIDELNAALNLADGGEFALTMRHLYAYLDRRLQESNVQKNTDGLQEVASHLRTLRDAWRQMLLQPTTHPSISSLQSNTIA